MFSSVLPKQEYELHEFISQRMLQLHHVYTTSVKWTNYSQLKENER